MRRIVAVLALLLVGLAGALRAQAIRGRLLDAETGRPIDAGRLLLLTQDSVPVQDVTTDSTGAFRLPVPRPGDYRLQAERAGYLAAVTPALGLRDRDTLQVEFRLSMRVVVLRPLTVVGDARRARSAFGGFLDRMEHRGFGTFVGRADIERMHPVRASDLLLTVPGVQVIPTWWGGGVVVMRGCVATLYLDGLRVRASSIDELVTPQDLEGIEVYRNAAEAPPQLAGGGSGCGVVAIWTRVD